MNKGFSDIFDSLGRFGRSQGVDDHGRPLGYVPSTSDKNAPLHDSPHYSDERFSRGQTYTIFGAKAKDLMYTYSDRFDQWDYKKSDEARESASASGAGPRTCRWYEAYLTAYRGKPTAIVHIIAGVNVSSGYPYLCFGYKDA